MLFSFEMYVPCRNVYFYFGANLANIILTPWVASLWKTQCITAMESRKQTGSEIANSKTSLAS